MPLSAAESGCRRVAVYGHAVYGHAGYPRNIALPIQNKGLKNREHAGCASCDVSAVGKHAAARRLAMLKLAKLPNAVLAILSFSDSASHHSIGTANQGGGSC